MRKIFVWLSVIIFLFSLAIPAPLAYSNSKMKIAKGAKWFDLSEEEEEEESSSEEKFLSQRYIFLKECREGVTLKGLFGYRTAILTEVSQEEPTPPPRNISSCYSSMKMKKRIGYRLNTHTHNG